MVKRRLIINRLELKNFLSHSDTKIGFGDGIHVFIGPNGAGKSSIVDALYILLAQPLQVKGIRGGRKTDLIRRTQRRAELVGWFTDELTGDEFRVKTVLSDRNSEAYLFKNGKLIASGITGVREQIKREFYPEGLDPESVLENTSIIRQGGLASIARLIAGPSASGRKEYFQELLGLKEYDKAVDKIKSIGVRIQLEPPYNKVFYPLDTGGSGLKALEGELQAVKSSLMSLKGRISEIREKLSRVEKEIQGLIKKKRSIEEELARLEEEKRRLDQLRGRLETLRGSLRELEESIREKKREAEKLRRELEATVIPAGIEDFYMHTLQPLRTVTKELELALKELEELNAKLGMLREAQASKDKSVKYEELAGRLKELANEKAVLKEKIGHLEEAKRKLGKWRNVEREFLARLEEEGIPAASLEEAEKDLAGIIEDLNSELRKLEEEINMYNNRLGAIAAGVNEAREKLRLLSDTSSTKCPLCGHELGPGEAERIKQALESKLEELRVEEVNTRNRLRDLVAKKNKLRMEIEEFRKLYSEAVRLTASKPDLPPGVNPGELDVVIDGYKKRLTSLEEEIRELEAAAKSLEPQWQLYNTVKRLYGDLDKALEELEGKSGLLKSSIQELTRRKEELEGRLENYVSQWGLPRDISKLEETLAGLIEKARILDREKEKLRRLEEEIGRLEEKYREAEKNIRELGEAIQAQEGKLRNYEELKSREKEVIDKLRELEGLKGELKGNLDSLEDQYDKLSQYLVELEKAKRKLRLLYRVRRLLERLPPLILYETLRSLEEEMSKIIQSFNLSYTGVLVDPDTLEFRVLDPSGADVSISQLSGGEQTAIALAFVIGLNRVLGGVTGFLVLDEPTTHLDPERRRSLVDIIERAVSQESGIRQLVIVTHHEEVRDAADVLCSVSKTGGTSRVECE